VSAALANGGGFRQVSLDVPGHRRERRAGGCQPRDVLAGPVPDLHLESKVVDGPDSIEERKLLEDHFGRHGKAEEIGQRHQGDSTPTGARVSTDSMQASAIASARRASRPVTTGLAPLTHGVDELDELG
jgi:hypothetical protein